MHSSVHDSGELSSPGERIAERILELLDESDTSDKRWRAPIFRQLPKRFAEIVAYDYKETYIFDGRQCANLALLKTLLEKCSKSAEFILILNIRFPGCSIERKSMRLRKHCLKPRQ